MKIAGRNPRFFVAYWTPTWYNNGKKEERL
nr:MAG TPA: hypothetical protein [Caudoviricetes sp.]